MLLNVEINRAKCNFYPKISCRNAICPKCCENCHSTKRIHLDFANDDNLACAQAKETLAAEIVDEVTIETLFDSVDSLTLDNQIAEENLLEMKQLIKKIDIVVNQTELMERLENEMENAKKCIEELRLTIPTKQIEIESIKAQMQDVEHTNETLALRKRREHLEMLCSLRDMALERMVLISQENSLKFV